MSLPYDPERKTSTNDLSRADYEISVLRSEWDALQERLRNVIPVVKMPLDEAKDPVAALIWHKAELAALRSAAAEMAEALETAAQELYHSAHSSGDPADETNMQSDAITYRECRAALSRWSALTGKDATK